MPDPIAKHLEVLADALATPGEGPPTCCGEPHTQHKPRPMRLVAVDDDGRRVWKCPRKRCQYVWRER